MLPEQEENVKICMTFNITADNEKSFLLCSYNILITFEAILTFGKVD